MNNLTILKFVVSQLKGYKNASQSARLLSRHFVETFVKECRQYFTDEFADAQVCDFFYLS